LTLNAKIHNVVAADGAIVYHNIPCPQCDGVPLLHFELLLWSFRLSGILLLLRLVTLGVIVLVFALTLHDEYVAVFFEFCRKHKVANRSEFQLFRKWLFPPGRRKKQKKKKTLTSGWLKTNGVRQVSAP